MRSAKRVVGGQPVAFFGGGEGVVAHGGVELVREAGGVGAEGVKLKILVWRDRMTASHRSEGSRRSGSQSGCVRVIREGDTDGVPA